MCGINHTKQGLRRKILQSLAELKRDERVEKSKKLSGRLDELMRPRQNLVWGVFAPLEDEPAWQMAIGNLQAFALAYPAFIAPGKMEFLRCREDELVACREFATQALCPPKEKSRAAPEALLVPGLGFTCRGERMGRGEGYYDRVLETFKGLSIGICFKEQLYGHLPVEGHDQRVAMVVTDEQIINCEQHQQ